MSQSAANDLDNVSSTIAQSTIQLMSSVLVISGSFVMMVMLSPALTAASLITVPLVFSVGKMVTKRTRTLVRTQQAALGQLNGYVEEMVSGMLVVKALTRKSGLRNLCSDQSVPKDGE